MNSGQRVSNARLLRLLASGLVAQTYGYPAVFAAGAVLTLCALAPVLMYFRAAGRSPAAANNE